MRPTSGLCGGILGVGIGLAASAGAHGCADRSGPELARMQRQLDELNVQVERQTYQRAFQKGWTRLEGRPEQLQVAEQSAVAKKKGLD
jgi:hypothetical protein